MATDKVQTGIRFEVTTLRKITYIAKRKRRSLNAQLEYLANECVREYESGHGAIVLDPDELYL